MGNKKPVRRGLSDPGETVVARSELQRGGRYMESNFQMPCMRAGGGVRDDSEMAEPEQLGQKGHYLLSRAPQEEPVRQGVKWRSMSSELVRHLRGW